MRRFWLDDRGEPPCFVAGTPIRTPDGELPIEQLEAGHVVLAYDVEHERPRAQLLKTHHDDAVWVSSDTPAVGRSVPPAAPSRGAPPLK